MFTFWKRKTAEPAAPEGPLDPPIHADVLAETEALGETVALMQSGVPDSTPIADALRSKRSWRERMRGSGFSRALTGVFSRNPRLDEALLDELEAVLLGADVGVSATTALIGGLRTRMNTRAFADANALVAALREDMLAILRPVARPLAMHAEERPFVLMVVGVNGVGKTTTIGKLAQHLKREGAKVMLAAGDTFRAAAVEQLTVWGARNDVPVMAQGEGADSASVIFDAMKAARARDIDVLIADTAGRLHTKSGLMDELSKIGRVLRKLDESAPHEVLLVIDGTTGQNAISQVQQFHQAIIVTGLAITKLDGTAKGGIVFALAQEFNLPIRYVGVGETLDDLRIFDPDAFVDGLLPDRFGAAA